MIWMFWFNMCMHLYISFYLLFQPFFQRPLFYGHCLDIIYSLEAKSLCELQNNCLAITYVQHRGIPNYWQIKEVFWQTVIILCSLRYKIKQVKQRSVVPSFAGNCLASRAPTDSGLALSQVLQFFSQTSRQYENIL